MTLNKIKETENLKKDEIFFFDKKSLKGPLNRQSKLLMHMADIDPENPGMELEGNVYYFIEKKLNKKSKHKKRCGISER